MIARRSPLKRAPLPPRKSYIKRSTKRIRPVNPIAKAKRDKRNAKDRRSPHTKEIERQARKRAGNRCERDFRGGGILEGLNWRCLETERLELHHLRYPRVRKLTVDDVQILCRAHHREAESRKPYKWNRRSVA